ncbi:response regulator [Pseudobacteriovorax antillogorgiicola]|uniref:Two-component system, chemotaxis family, response regulator CheY n=1 Tax=Pseudobacteriovorax antillogorgiicola TaxID=1513793 RepID=A0A1Y6CMJ4_9BACT|nr:response regulator [Pseudobacteriovorax antillogorgiicola]TCS47319.1 two-component system chemotaxis response regulator CheY [Pseudobacteriovorax antillogorgiicola]SMF62791.1 two-component system, chemotaxis family, response regulator CheY [Pseudobacteriovorax antillogorgiicola]
MAKILLVDDSEFMRYEIRALLVGLGHDVVEAHDGLQGYRLAREHKDFNLIISDFNMPTWDGLHMIAEIRSIEAYKTVPIGMLTTESSKNLKYKGKELGITVWYVKPLDPDIFCKTVTAVLERSEQPA